MRLVVPILLLLTGCAGLRIDNVGARASPDEVCMTFPAQPVFPGRSSEEDDNTDWMKKIPPKFPSDPKPK